MTMPEPANHERFGWLERKNDDFPYYRGLPVSLAGWQWLAIILSVFIGFAFILFPPQFLQGPVSALIPVLLFPAIPLATLAWFAPAGWTALFRRLQGTDFLWMIFFAILNIVVALIMGSVLIAVTETTKNAGVAGLVDQSSFDRLMFFIRSIPQLFGEEVFSILPFLALLWFFARRGMSRRLSIIISALLVALLFAAAHLPTYGYNLVQAIGGVGVARIVLLLPYIMTKNIWVSTGSHILNDWFSFGLAIVSAERMITQG